MKYKILTDEYKRLDERVLYRIQATKDFGDVKAGDKGGWVESEFNLCGLATCWIYDEACVFDRAYVWGDAKVRNRAMACDSVRIGENSEVLDNAWLMGNVFVRGDARLGGYTRVNGVVTIDL